jgi:hypothetical protein
MHQFQMDYMWHSTFNEPGNVIANLSKFVSEHPGNPHTDHQNDPLMLWNNRSGHMDVFSTNLEWVRIEAFRRQEIMDWKEEVERNGGIYRHRWGDAPLRTIVATQFLNTSRVGRFCGFSYNHSSWDPFRACNEVGKRVTDLYRWRTRGDADDDGDDERKKTGNMTTQGTSLSITTPSTNVSIGKSQ